MPDDAAARLAIRDLVARYCDAVVRADADAFRHCWAEDARWTGPGLDRTGVDTITRTFARSRARFAVAIPAVVSGTVRVDGPRATGRWWIREALVQTDGATRATTGRYDDEYVRVDGEWRFAHRDFTPVGA